MSNPQGAITTLQDSILQLLPTEALLNDLQNLPDLVLRNAKHGAKQLGRQVRNMAHRDALNRIAAAVSFQDWSGFQDAVQRTRQSVRSANLDRPSVLSALDPILPALCLLRVVPVAGRLDAGLDSILTRAGELLSAAFRLPSQAGLDVIAHINGASSWSELSEHGSDFKPARSAPETSASEPSRDNSRSYFPPTPVFPDYPQYTALLRAREHLLQQIPDKDRIVYWSRKLPANPFNQSWREPMMKALTNMAGSGPWTEYELLDDSSAWKYQRYFDVVSKSSVHASIPCKNGCLPAFYVMKYGTVDHLRQMLELYPPAAQLSDAGGRTALLDAVLLEGTQPKIEMLLQFGADPQAQLNEGMSVFTAALNCFNYEAVRSLLDAGYDPSKDTSIDQERFARVLNAPATAHFGDRTLSVPRVPEDLVPRFEAICAQVPARSRVTLLQEQASENYMRSTGLDKYIASLSAR